MLLRNSFRRTATRCLAAVMLAMLPLIAACELLADFDRDLLPKPEASTEPPGSAPTDDDAGDEAGDADVDADSTAPELDGGDADTDATGDAEAEAEADAEADPDADPR